MVSSACSNELVNSLRREMKECVGRVTRGRVLLDLAAVFQVGLCLGPLFLRALAATLAGPFACCTAVQNLPPCCLMGRIWL